MVGRDDYLGRVVFDMNEVPTRVPPDSPLAPQWYRLEDRRGEGKVRGNIMLAVWLGTQADEAFSEAWHSDAASVHGEGVSSIRSKVYVSPKLWYLRVNVIEAQDIQPNDRSRVPEVFVKAQVGSQVLRSKICPTRTTNPLWNEDLDRVHPSKDDVLGRVSMPLTAFEKRLDHRPVHSTWFHLEKFGFGTLEADRRKELKFSSRIHVRVCLEGGYHVLDESTMYISDQRPTARQLWKQPIGILEVGILGAQGLLPMKMKDSRGSTDAYCVARYGQKWGQFEIHELGRLGRAEPPLRKEVVEYMLDVDSHMWSMRRSKANFFRIMSLLSGVITMSRWFGNVCHWKNPITSLSWAEAVQPDELDEEFDTFPTSRSQDRVYMRYDRLRSVAGRIQTVVGDLATQGERFQSLLSWRDPRATSLFIMFCLCTALVLYMTPFRAVALVAGLYMLRHPRFRSKLPSIPNNFFKRLPPRTDSLL
ncbi:unnamed protein product, partial [Vitis vinifera]